MNTVFYQSQQRYESINNPDQPPFSGTKPFHRCRAYGFYGLVAVTAVMLCLFLFAGPTKHLQGSLLVTSLPTSTSIPHAATRSKDIGVATPPRGNVYSRNSLTTMPRSSALQGTLVRKATSSSDLWPIKNLEHQSIPFGVTDAPGVVHDPVIVGVFSGSISMLLLGGVLYLLQHYFRATVENSPQIAKLSTCENREAVPETTTSFSTATLEGIKVLGTERDWSSQSQRSLQVFQVPFPINPPRVRGCPKPAWAMLTVAPIQDMLDDEKVKKLFAWLCRAFEGEQHYNNLMLAFAAVFGEDAVDSPFGEALAEIRSRPGVGDALNELVEIALAKLPPEDVAVGQPLSLRDREQGCLGAMGAGTWTGQSWVSRPHALLDVRNLTRVEEWTRSLPRGARRTLAKANAQEFTVVARPIRGDEPAPHSSLAHFRCVVEHEVRVLADSPDTFFEALQHGIARYQNCISQGGEILEYRDTNGRVIAFAQEVTKGKVIRGQWFYATDVGARQFVWFHSVQELVRRAIEDDAVDYADLGPSGSDAFSELKEKYGFQSVSDWFQVADYRGPFRYSFGSGQSWAELDPPDYLFEPSILNRMFG